MKTVTFQTTSRSIYYKQSARTEGSLGQVIMMGNAYGVMPYQEPLAEALSGSGFDIYWFPFNGQAGSVSGEFSIRSGAQDLAEVIEFVQDHRDDSEKLPHILAHCASGLITMEYLKNIPKSLVNKVIIYGLLAQPGRLRSRAEKKLEQLGVRSGLHEWDWNYSAEEAATKQPSLSFLLCHADDVLNRRRASRNELEQIQAQMPNSTIKVFHKGYDRSLDAIPAYASFYTSWLMER